MARFGIKKPVVYFMEAKPVTTWASAGGGAQCNMEYESHALSVGDHIQIADSTSLNGYYQVQSVPTADQIIINKTYADQENNGTWRKCWSMELDNTMVYYVPNFENASIINESPINGHISTVNLAEDADEGRYRLDLTLNNLTAAQYARYEDMRALATMNILIHEDDLKGLGELNFTLLKYREFAGEHYPIVDNVFINLIATDYEQIK